MAVIEWKYKPQGNCPVQSEGTINGLRFYFRARGDGWSLEISEDREFDPADEPDTRCYSFFGPFGDKDFEAGWMKHETAEAIIERVASFLDWATKHARR